MKPLHEPLSRPAATLSPHSGERAGRGGIVKPLLLHYTSNLFSNPNSIQRVSQTPIFFDSIWILAEPLESDSPPRDLYTGAYLGTTIQCCTILRHGGRTATSSYPFPLNGQRQALPGAINVGLADGHAELSPLRNLWNYYWHLNWKPP